VLLFVTSFNIQHPVRSDDPIFPFRTPITPDTSVNPDIDQLMTYWTNKEKHGAVLGCVEYAEICEDASNVSCFDPWANLAMAPPSDEMYALGLGLLYSGNWMGLNTRTSKELDATRKIVDISISMPLAQEQWKIEAQRIFEISMIRARLEVLELARGTRSTRPSFIDVLPDVRRAVCQIVKFQSVGYKNLSVAGLLFAFLTPPILAIRIKKMPLFYWPIHGILKLAKLRVRDKPLIQWLWIGVKKLYKIVSDTTQELCSKARELVWKNIAKVTIQAIRALGRLLRKMGSFLLQGLDNLENLVGRLWSSRRRTAPPDLDPEMDVDAVSLHDG
jgi:hypothetical protein